MQKDKSYYSHGRNDILRLIPNGAKRILDVGCGNGALGKELKKMRMEVVGIEMDAGAFEEAKVNLDNALLGDVEKISLPFPEGYFDCIIFADILEHLHEPKTALERYRRYLNNDGCVISSIPNVRYYKVIIRLLKGAWDYADAGPLDKSHLRFFTLINIKEMFEAAGYEIERVGRNIVAARGFEILNFLFFNKLKEFLTYQYYVIAKKNLTGTVYSKKRKIYKF